MPIKIKSKIRLATTADSPSKIVIYVCTHLPGNLYKSFLIYVNCVDIRIYRSFVILKEEIWMM